MDVALLYFDGCPNWAQTQKRLEEALTVLGADPMAYRLAAVASAEDAERGAMRRDRAACRD